MPILQRPLAALATLALASCAATTSPRYDARFGDSKRMLQAQQTLDPKAATRNAGQMVRSDGRTAAEANGRYVDSFKAPAAPASPTGPTINFNAGNAAAGR